MHFAHKDLQAILSRELRNAAAAYIAVPYFNPENTVLAILREIPKLTIVVSEEYTVTNPYKLEELSKAKIVRTVPTDSDNGKLHAKVFLVTRKDGSIWAMVGSANLTLSGMTSNQEACLLLDSQYPHDASELRIIATWCEQLLYAARAPNLEDAKKIFDARSAFRLEPRPVQGPNTNGYWVLKTTSGSSGEDHWKKFLAHKAIAIGWSVVGDPTSMTKSQLENAIAARHDGDAKRAATKVRKFIDLADGDIIMICKGYAGNQGKAVHVYGIARVLGPFQIDPTREWDWFTRPAVIQEVNEDIPRNEIARCLRKESLLEAIHQIDERGFREVVELLGVQLIV